MDLVASPIGFNDYDGRLEGLEIFDSVGRRVYVQYELEPFSLRRFFRSLFRPSLPPCATIRVGELEPERLRTMLRDRLDDVSSPEAPLGELIALVSRVSDE